MSAVKLVKSEKLHNEINRKHGLFLFLIMGILITGTCIVFSLPYYAADDYLMNYIANGSFGNSTNLIYPNVVVGTFLRGLYQLIPGVNWYFVVYQAIMVISATLGLIIVLKYKNVLATILYISACVGLTFFLSFTVVAYCGVGFGTAYIFYLLDLDRKNKKEYILPIIMIIVGTLIRESTLLSALVLFLPVILVKLLKAPRKRHEWIGIIGGAILIMGSLGYSVWIADGLVELILCAVLIVIGWFLSRKKLSDFSMLFWSFLIIACSVVFFHGVQVTVEEQSGWSEFREYTDARSKVIDRPYVAYDLIADELEAIGVSEADYDILWQWTFLDKEVFSAENLLKISQICKAHYSSTSVIGVFLSKEVLGFLGMGLLAVIILLVSAKKKKIAGWLCFSLAILFLLYSMLAIQQRFKLYVAMPLLTIFILQMSLIVGKNISESNGKRRALASVLAVLLVAATGVKLNNLLEIGKVRSQKMESLVQEIGSSDKLYIVQSFLYNSIFDNVCYPAYEIEKTDMFHNLIKSGSGDSFSPRYYENVQEWGVESPDKLLIQLVWNDRMYYVGNNGENVLRYLEGQVDGTVTMVVEKEFPGNVCIYKYTIEKYTVNTQ